MELQAILLMRLQDLRRRVEALELRERPIDDLFETDTPPPAATDTWPWLGRLKPALRLIRAAWEIVSALFEFAPYLATAAGAVWFGVLVPLLRVLGLLWRALGLG